MKGQLILTGEKLVTHTTKTSIKLSEKHAILYHTILKREAEIVGEDPITGKGCTTGDLCMIRRDKLNYCLTRNDLIKIARDAGISEPDALVNDLIQAGALIEVSKECYRSFHFDFMIRAAYLRGNPEGGDMIIGAQFSLTFRPIGYPSERTILPRKHGESQLERELWNLIEKSLGPKLTFILIKALSRYFETIGSKGYTEYQALAIKEYLEYQDAESFALIAPTGIGKTEIFTFIMLHELLKARLYNKKSRVIIVYPRKMLETNQAERLIILLAILNEELSKVGLEPIKLYIRDGDTYNLKINAETKGMVPFRGIQYKGKELLVDSTGKIYLRYPNEDKVEEAPDLSFIIPFQGITAKEADIVITNANTLMYRSLSLPDNDIGLNEILEAEVIVLDEAHEYSPVMLANLSYLVRSIKCLKEGKVKTIISTATLHNPIEFASKLSGVTEDKVVDISYERLKTSLHRRMGQKAELTLFIQVHPQVSWATYIAELTTVQLFVYWASLYEMKQFTPQAIFFVNNVKELSRLYGIIDNSLSLGSPTRKLCIKKPKAPSKCDSLSNPHYMVHYNYSYPKAYNEAKKSFEESGNLYNILSRLYMIVFSGVPLEKRAEIYREFRENKLGNILATSSLELGMDYPQVSIIVNAGFDRLPSLIQRFGRGGRSIRSLYTTLNMLVVRNNPIEYMLYADKETLKNIISGKLKPSMGSPIALDTPAVLTYALLRHAAMIALLEGKIEFSSKSRYLSKWHDKVITAIISELNTKEFKKYLNMLNIDDEKVISHLQRQLTILQNLLRNFQEYIDNLIEALDEAFIGIDIIIRKSKAIIELLDQLNARYKEADELEELKKLKDTSKKLIYIANEINYILTDIDEQLYYLGLQTEALYKEAAISGGKRGISRRKERRGKRRDRKKEKI